MWHLLRDWALMNASIVTWLLGLGSLLLFAVVPYLCIFLFFLGTIMRYRKAPFTYSSLSSQFLENQQCHLHEGHHRPLLYHQYQMENLHHYHNLQNH